MFWSQGMPWRSVGRGGTEPVTKCRDLPIFSPLSWFWKIVAKRTSNDRRVLPSQIPGDVGFATLTMQGRLCPTSQSWGKAGMNWGFSLPMVLWQLVLPLRDISAPHPCPHVPSQLSLRNGESGHQGSVAVLGATRIGPWGPV